MKNNWTDKADVALSAYAVLAHEFWPWITTTLLVPSVACFVAGVITGFYNSHRKT